MEKILKIYPLPHLCAIFGPGRSGTTWLGSIINSHPDVIYRFEPFGCRKKNSAIKKSRIALTTGNFTHEIHELLYNYLIRADPLTDKPPFFKKTYFPALGKLWFWRVVRVLPPIRPLYRLMYTPSKRPTLVFKEVGSLTAKTFIENTPIPFVYLVRHPCATVSSLVAGQFAKKTPDGRTTVVESLIMKHDSHLYERIKKRIKTMDPYEKNALIWRTDVERVINTIHQCKRGLVLTYEQLCDDAPKQAYRICEEFGLSFHNNIQCYLDNLYRFDNLKKRKPSDVRDAHFTVFRNPNRQRELWKHKLPSDTQKRILNLISDSSAVQYCANIGGWDI